MEDFYDMTMREFNAILEGRNWQEEREDRITARYVAAILNTCGYPSKHRRSVSVNKLSPRRNLAPANPLYRSFTGMK